MQTTCGCGAATGDEAFIRTLDTETRHIIEDPEGAPELINTGEEVFAQYDRHELTEWTRLEFGKDPVTGKNIMYKGHLNLVYALYRLISGSYEFDEEYRHLNDMIVRENLGNARNRNFWDIECEPDQWFTPCNAIGMLSEAAFDRNFHNGEEADIAMPAMQWTLEHMVDPETGVTLFRYHPSCDFAEPYTLGSLWTESCFHHFAPAEMERAYESIKREFLPEIKGGKEVYLKANRYTYGMSTDYEQATMVLYVPQATREFNDPEEWEKITRFFCDMYDITLVNGVARFTSATPQIESHAVGHLFLAAVHLGWDKILSTDWDAFRAERGRA